MSEYQDVEQQANALMTDGLYKDANLQFCYAWNSYCELRKSVHAQGGDIDSFDEEHPPADAFWLLMNGANSAYHCGDFPGCLSTCITAANLFQEIGLVVGNPFFHLRTGQSAYELATPEERKDNQRPANDNLARALIGGGIEIFNGENPKYEEHTADLLLPPEGFEKWRDTKLAGCSLEVLNGATGFIRLQIEAKFGEPLSTLLQRTTDSSSSP